MKMLAMWLPVFAKFNFFNSQDTPLGMKNEAQSIPAEDHNVLPTSATKEATIIKNKRPMTSVCRKLNPVVLVHGGAGNIPDYMIPAKINCVKKAAVAGYKVLNQGGTSAEAVEAAIRVMEDDPLMNAGYGSVLNYEGEVECDACIMVGKTLDAGGVTAAKDVANPISLAKLVMEKTPHTLLAGEGARRFAEENKFPLATPGSLVTLAAKEALEAYKENPDDDLMLEVYDIKEKPEKKSVSLETVGAVALDRRNRLAVGSSTGGLLGKMVGRVGDSAQIGKGAYCDDELGGVTTTGHGESITKYCLSVRVLKEIEMGKNAQEATTAAVKNMYEKLNKDAGAICVSAAGDIGMHWTTTALPWAYQREEELHYGSKLGEDNVEKSVL